MYFFYAAIGFIPLAYYLYLGQVIEINNDYLWPWLVAAGCIWLHLAGKIYRKRKNKQTLLSKSLKVSLRFTVCSLLVLYLSVLAFFAGNSFKKVENNLNYVILTSTVIDFAHATSSSYRAWTSAIEYLKENPDTILAISAARDEEGKLVLDEEISNHLKKAEISAKRYLLFPEGTGYRRLVKNSVSYIKTDWYGKEVAVVLEPRIGIITQELNSYHYLTYYQNESSMKFYEIAAKIPVWYLPQLSWQEIGEFIHLHINGKI